MNIDGQLAGLVHYLKENIGLKLTAHVCGLSDVHSVNSWLKGKHPKIETEIRIRYAYQSVLFVREAYGKEMAVSWLCGINAHLDGKAPAIVLREAKNITELENIVSAAKSFVSS